MGKPARRQAGKTFLKSNKTRYRPEEEILTLCSSFKIIFCFSQKSESKKYGISQNSAFSELLCHSLFSIMPVVSLPDTFSPFLYHLFMKLDFPLSTSSNNNSYRTLSKSFRNIFVIFRLPIFLMQSAFPGTPKIHLHFFLKYREEHFSDFQ